MRKIFDNGKTQIWAVTETHGTDFYVYGVAADPRVCPSLEMAMAVAAK